MVLEKVSARINRFIHRVKWLHKINQGWGQSIALALRLTLNYSQSHQIHHWNSHIVFRSNDVLILEEVLADQEYAFLKEFLLGQLAPVVLDVGSHIGTFAIWVLATNPSAKVVSVEADPDTFSILRQNAENYSVKGANWQTIEAAASAATGNVIKFSNVGPSMSHHVDHDGAIEVQSISLQTLLELNSQNSSHVDLLKVDIEGSEEDFLCASESLLEFVRVLVVELHPTLCDTNRIRDVLNTRYSHVVEIQQRNSNKPLLYCWR